MDNMIELKSVGTVINMHTLKTYPINKDNTIDYNCGVYIDDCTNEWWYSLSIKDKKTIAFLTSKNIGAYNNG